MTMLQRSCCLRGVPVSFVPTAFVNEHVAAKKTVNPMPQHAAGRTTNWANKEHPLGPVQLISTLVKTVSSTFKRILKGQSPSKSLLEAL